MQLLRLIQSLTYYFISLKILFFIFVRQAPTKSYTMNSFKCICILLYTSTLSAQELTTTSAKTYITKEINITDAPQIDGNLDDPVWASVEWGTRFIEVNPDENTDPSVETMFKILYDQKYLYVALKALDPEPETITNRLSRRDGFVGDRINVLIDSYHDLRTAFLFTVTAAGV